MPGEQKNSTDSPQEMQENLLFFIQSCQKASIQKAQTEYISDKRFQAPFMKQTSHRVVCNSYQKLVYLPKIRFNAKLGTTNKKQTSVGS